MRLTVRGYAMALDGGDDEIKKIMQRKK